jgi:hypothetical protein
VFPSSHTTSHAGNPLANSAPCGCACKRQQTRRTIARRIPESIHTAPGAEIEKRIEWCALHRSRACSRPRSKRSPTTKQRSAADEGRSGAGGAGGAHTEPSERIHLSPIRHPHRGLIKPICKREAMRRSRLVHAHETRRHEPEAAKSGPKRHCQNHSNADSSSGETG